MYRVRCSSGRRLLACVSVCMLLTLILWLRCDDSISGLTASASASDRHASLVTASSVSNAAAAAAAVGDDDGYHDAANGNEEEEEEVMGQADVDNDDAAQVYGGRGRADTRPSRRAAVAQSSHYHSIECLINNEYSVSCRQDSSGEVYLPFKFVSKYFEVYGKMSDDNEVFYWQHSYSRVFIPDSSYSPTDGFMSFEHYNVDIRDRVKCISATEGVPLSNQWGHQGYFYPIQIAQYGLSHYSKYVKKSAKSSRPPVVIEDAEDGSSSRWSVTGDAAVHSVFDADAHSRVIQFQTAELTSSDSVVSLMFPDFTPAYFFLALSVRFTTNGSISVLIQTSRHRTTRIHYACTDTVMSSVGGETVYGIGTDRTSWGWTLGRDIAVDLQKGLGHKYGGRKKRAPPVVARRIVGLELRGTGRIDNVTIASNGHLLQFYYAADWLVRHQDGRGGWKIMVSRSVAEGQLSLEPGWYSAMAQGQAMSLLIRAHAWSHRREYLDAAVRALALFDVQSANSGIVAKFMDRYVWYEEYPTTPPCFVLNGFMYALIGLYDVAATAPPGDGQSTAQRLYSSGVTSLRSMLPLFDTGSGTVYDLRHLTLGGAAPPNRARWDYHATHVNQLLLLSSLLRNGSVTTDEPTATEFKAVANRWLGYMKGKLAPHN